MNVFDLTFWPDCISVKKALLVAFRARCKKVESLIDCFEIEKPSNLLRQDLTWSNYKKMN